MSDLKEYKQFNRFVVNFPFQTYYSELSIARQLAKPPYTVYGTNFYLMNDQKIIIYALHHNAFQYYGQERPITNEIKYTEYTLMFFINCKFE